MGLDTRRNEIHRMTDDELHKELISLRKELSDLRFDVAGTRKKDSKEKKTITQDIARVMTEMSSRRRMNEAPTDAPHA